MGPSLAITGSCDLGQIVTVTSFLYFARFRSKDIGIRFH